MKKLVIPLSAFFVLIFVSLLGLASQIEANELLQTTRAVRTTVPRATIHVSPTPRPLHTTVPRFTLSAAPTATMMIEDVRDHEHDNECTGSGYVAKGFEFDRVMNDNPFFDCPQMGMSENGIPQMHPMGWGTHSQPGSIDGLDEFSDHARIICRDNLCTMNLNNTITGITGHWGFSQQTWLNQGCYLMKVTGNSNVNDPPNGQNYGISFNLKAPNQDPYPLGEGDNLVFTHQLPLQGYFEIVSPFYVELDNSLILHATMISEYFATAGHESRVDVSGIGVIAVTDNYCGR